ncbi:hypothetical protein QBC39DRAFT_331261 [Podospora conica]|nr:hypothetical protein QBC39DRAFT_331261 [Schizothecium conicum]
MGPDLDIPAHEKGPEWTSDTRDEKLRTLLQGKQDDAENARILIDLLENGFLGADSSGDSDSEDGSDLDALTMSRADSADIPLPDDVDFDVGSDMPRPDPAAVPLPSSPRYFEDDVEYGVTVAAGLQSSGFDPDIVIEEPTTLSPGIHGLPVGVARRDNRQAESATRIANGVSVAQAVDGVDASDSDSDQSGWGAHGNKARGKKITSPRSGGEAEELVAWFGEDQADGRLQVSSTKGWESLSTRFQLEAETLDGASGEQNERKERVLERGLRGESDEGADLDLVPRRRLHSAAHQKDRLHSWRTTKAKSGSWSDS